MSVFHKFKPPIIPDSDPNICALCGQRTTHEFHAQYHRYKDKRIDGPFGYYRRCATCDGYIGDAVHFLPPDLAWEYKDLVDAMRHDIERLKRAMPISPFEVNELPWNRPLEGAPHVIISKQNYTPREILEHDGSNVLRIGLRRVVLMILDHLEGR